MSKKTSVRTCEKVINFPSPPHVGARDVIWVLSIYDRGKEKYYWQFSENGKGVNIFIFARSVERAVEIRDKFADALGLSL